jgi:hypothetical protein
LDVSSATNKTISSGKFFNISNSDSLKMWGIFWMGAEILKASFVLVYCTYSLYYYVGYACICPFFFILLKMGIDIKTRKWRDGTWKKSG